MNNAKTASNKKVQADAKPKNDKAPAKTANAKTADKPKPAAKPKDNVVSINTQVKVAKAADGKVFRVDKNGGPLREVDQKSAITDIVDTSDKAFNAETVCSLFDKGSVVASEFFNYSTNPAKLAKWEKELPDVPAAPKPKDAVNGDVVINLETALVGEVISADGALKVHFKREGRKTSVTYKPAKWRLATEEEAKAFRTPETAIVVVEAEIIPAMTDAEKAELVEREAAILDAKQQFESAPWLMAANLREIFAKRLNRETLNDAGVPMTNGDYAFAKFGITRAYAQNLAQLGEFKLALVDGVEHSDQMEMSINAANQLVRGTNQLVKGLGAGEIKGFDPLRPIIKSIGQLLFDIAPKDKDGNADITPRLVDSLNSTLSEIVKSDSVTIDGKSMKLTEAREKGLLSASVQTEILEKAAEGILTNQEIIRTEAKKSYDASNASQTPKAPTGPVSFYTGEVPTLGLVCAKHGETQVIAVGTGTFQTKCKCRWRVDHESGELKCFEVNSKTVKADLAVGKAA